MPLSSPTDGVMSMVLGFSVGSMVLVPLLFSVPRSRIIQVPSAPLSTVKALAFSCVNASPFTIRAVARHVPSIRLRSFLIASSFTSSAVAKVAAPMMKAAKARNPMHELFMTTSRMHGVKPLCSFALVASNPQLVAQASDIVSLEGPCRRTSRTDDSAGGHGHGLRYHLGPRISRPLR